MFVLCVFKCMSALHVAVWVCVRWTFRYVLQFLRDGPSTLPASKPLLKQLFREAQWWKLVTLQAAVEEM